MNLSRRTLAAMSIGVAVATLLGYTAAELSRPQTAPHVGAVTVYSEGGHYYAVDEKGNVICRDSDTACIQEAIDYSVDRSIKQVKIRPGVYKVSKTVKIPAAFQDDLSGGFVLEGEMQSVITNAPGFADKLLEYANHSVPYKRIIISKLRFLAYYEGPTSAVPIDLSMKEDSTGSVLFAVDIKSRNVTTTPSCLSLDGNEDISLIAVFVENERWAGSTTPCIRHLIPYGAASDFGGRWLGGGVVSAQQYNFFGTVFGPFQDLYLMPGYGDPATFNLHGAYFNSGAIHIMPNPNIGATSAFLNMYGVYFPDATPNAIINDAQTPISIYINMEGSYITAKQQGSYFFSPFIEGYLRAESSYISGFLLNQAQPQLSPNPPEPGAVYRNPYPFEIRILLPVYASTPGTPGVVKAAVGPGQTPQVVAVKRVGGDTTQDAPELIELKVPPRWYYSFEAVGVKFGTASAFVD
ncbi:MAG: hypothetical protein QXP98_01990 [Thermoproteus sp.]